MQTQTLIFLMGKLLTLVGLVLVGMAIQNPSTVVAALIVQAIFVAIYAYGLECTVTGGCDTFAWTVAYFVLALGVLTAFGGAIIFSMRDEFRRMVQQQQQRRR